MEQQFDGYAPLGGPGAPNQPGRHELNEAPLEVSHVADSRTASRLSQALELMRWRSPKTWGSIAVLPLIIMARHIFDLVTGESPSGSVLLGTVGLYLALLVVSVFVVTVIAGARMFKVNSQIRSYAAVGTPMWARYGVEAMEVSSASGFTTIAYNEIKNVVVVAGVVVVRRNVGSDIAIPRELVPESAAALLRPGLQLRDRWPRTLAIAGAVIVVLTLSIGVGSTPALSGPIEYQVGVALILVVGFGLAALGLARRRRDKSAVSSTARTTTWDSVGGTAPRIPIYKRSAALALAGAVLLASGLLGIGLSEVLGNGVSVGDCVLANDFHQNRIVGLHPTGCGDPDAVYELAARVRSGHMCPDGKVEDSAYFVISDDLQTLCFAPDVIVGACYSVPFGQDTRYEITPIDCADKMAVGTLMRVTARFDGSTDGGRCPLGPSVIPQPPRVVCWANHHPPR